MSQSGIAKLHVDVTTKPQTRLLKYLPVPFLYVHGNHFKISISIKNLGSAKFNGGEIRVLIKYAFGNLSEGLRVKIPAIDVDVTTELDLTGKNRWGVLAHGHTLILAEVFLPAGNTIQLYDKDGEQLAHQNGGYHVQSFYSLSRGELFTLIALYTNILLAILLNYEEIIDVFTKIFEFITSSISEFISWFL